MKGQAKTALTAAAVLFVVANLGFSQTGSLSAPATPPAADNPDGLPTASRTVMNAGPGSINYVEGAASIDNHALSPRSVGSVVLQPGQLINTADGYVEILLTPGAFLRVGHNSGIRLLSAGLAASKVELTRGSSVLEVDQLIKGTNLTVAANGAAALIQKPGLYSFDTSQQSIAVLDGKAKVSFDDRSQTLGKHDRVLLASDKPLKKRSFDENAAKADPLYVWSKVRSEDESQASLQAAGNATSYATAGTGWFWNPYYLSYGFWPASAALYSPFGWGFYSPAYFGFYGGGYYGGGYYGGYPRYYARPGYWHGHVGGVNARVGRTAGTGGFRSTGGGFHGGFGGGGGFHGGGHR